MIKHKRTNKWYRAALLLILVMLTAACNRPTETPTPSPSATITQTAINIDDTQLTKTPTRQPTKTPTTAPLGSEQNPIQLAFVIPNNDSESVETTQSIAFQLESETGFVFQSKTYESFQALVSAIDEQPLHLFWLKPLEYLYLSQQEQAYAMLMTNHLGVYAYGVQYMAHTGRGFTSFFDASLNSSIGDPIEALQQFSGTRPCFTDPNSLTGYYVPMGLLANTSTPTLDPVFTYDVKATLRALYIQDICDFGVSYAIVGDPRTASEITLRFPDILETIDIIWQSPPIIPNLNLSAAPSLPLHIRVRLQEAFLELAKDATFRSNLNQALDYEVEALKPVTDSFYHPLRDALNSLELDIESITQQIP